MRQQGRNCTHTHTHVFRPLLEPAPPSRVLSRHPWTKSPSGGRAYKIMIYEHDRATKHVFCSVCLGLFDKTIANAAHGLLISQGNRSQKNKRQCREGRKEGEKSQWRKTGFNQDGNGAFLKRIVLFSLKKKKKSPIQKQKWGALVNIQPISTSEDTQ